MFSNKYKSAVSKAVTVCEAAAEGDFEMRVLNITEDEEAGRLLHAINSLIDRSDAYIRESQASLLCVAKNKYYRRISEKGMPGTFGVASNSNNMAMQAIEDRIVNFTSVVSKFEDQMKEVVESVSSAAVQLNVSAKSMETATSSAKVTADEVSSSAAQANSNVESVSVATEEMSSSVNEINQQVLQSSEISSNAVKEIEVSSKDIATLSDASEKIGAIVSLIKAIAEQTNLLALNATIEAARAGESGKGFAVVASEVKELASQTSKATDEIEAQVSEIQLASNKAVESIDTIGKTISRVDEISSAIASAVEEQSAATTEISRNIQQASTVTTEVSSNIENITYSVDNTLESAKEVLGASDELASNGETMRTEVANFLTEIRKVV